MRINSDKFAWFACFSHGNLKNAFFASQSSHPHNTDTENILFIMKCYLFRPRQQHMSSQIRLSATRSTPQASY